MQRFERKLASARFADYWEVELDGSTLVWREGIIGKSGGYVRTGGAAKKYARANAASSALAKMIAAKKKQKYREVEVPVFVPSTAPSARNAELEAAIAAAPEDPAGYLVYADWLTGQGDPRGELIVVQHALESASGKRATALRKREQTLLAKLQTHLFGRFPVTSKDYPDPAVVRVTEWRRGFFRTLRLLNDDWDHDPKIVELLREFFALPAARFVDNIGISVLQWMDSSNQTPAALIEIGKRIGPQVKTLVVGHFERGDNVDNDHFHAGALGAAWKYFPALESLKIYSGAFELGKLELPALKELVLETCSLRRAAVRAICKTPRPHLEKLALWFGSTRYGADVRLTDLQPMLDGAGLPKLGELGLMNCEFTDAICEVLPRAKVLPRLRVLDLSMGCMGDEGARALAKHPDAFGHLAELRLDQNFLSPAGIALVRKLARKVTTADQKDVDNSTNEAIRYVSVSE